MGQPHVPPYHHPPSLHAAQLHMLLSHSPTAMSSENHAPLAYHRKGNTWGRKEDMDTDVAAKSKEVRQWTEGKKMNERVEDRRGEGRGEIGMKQNKRKLLRGWKLVSLEREKLQGLLVQEYMQFWSSEGHHSMIMLWKLRLFKDWEKTGKWKNTATNWLDNMSPKVLQLYTLCSYVL